MLTNEDFQSAKLSLIVNDNLLKREGFENILLKIPMSFANHKSFLRGKIIFTLERVYNKANFSMFSLPKVQFVRLTKITGLVQLLFVIAESKAYEEIINNLSNCSFRLWKSSFSSLKQLLEGKSRRPFFFGLGLLKPNE